MSLSDLPIGKTAKIIGFSATEGALIRFMEMGLRANEAIAMLGRLPLGGNLIVLSDHGKYSLRLKEARQIKIAPALSPI